MNQPYQAGEFTYREIRQDDRAEVLALTAHTWEFGDYIQYVFDDWVADRRGRFLVAEERESGRIAAIDKLTMLSPTEAWFEGLRVHKDFRRRGLASRLQIYMIGEAARLGAQTVRLTTLATNRPVHLACYRDGFSLKCVLRFWKWEERKGEIAANREEPTYKLRYATSQEALVLYKQWKRSAAFRTAGLAHISWSFAQSSAEEWQTAAVEQRLLVREDAPVDAAAMPAACALVRNDTNHMQAPIWVLSALTALGEEWAPLMRGLVNAARETGISEINGLQPDMHDLYAGFQSARFVGDLDEDRLCLFELSPVPGVRG
jgi:GNAT superfamily N-acetyltransferase